VKLLTKTTLATITPPYSFKTVADVVNAFLPAIYGVGTLIFIVFVIWAGIDWITSGGEAGKIQAAQKKLTAAVIGFVIMILAFAIEKWIEGLI